MGKKVLPSQPTVTQPSLLATSASLDQHLSRLFEHSAGPVKIPSILSRESSKISGAAGSVKSADRRVTSRSRTEYSPSSTEDKESENSHESNEAEESDGNDSQGGWQSQEDSGGEQQRTSGPSLLETGNNRPRSMLEPRGRKRKRTGIDHDLEARYWQRISKEHLKGGHQPGKEQPKPAGESEPQMDDSSPPPAHEALTGETEATELDKARRTVFVGNISSEAIRSKFARKALLAHLASFFPDLPPAHTSHKVESVRFRSTAYAARLGVPKRASFARKQLMDATTPSTNAYAVYSTVQAAQRAPAALNGTVILDRHIRVDQVAHPTPIDHKRCVFVGNLCFVDDDTHADDEDADNAKSQPKKKRKPSTPSDIEEGLWRTFNAHTGQAGAVASKDTSRGPVESVRVIRDPATRVGKGFAYVQFYDPNCVEEALLLAGKKFPPLLPRTLRVTRARKTRLTRPSGNVANDVTFDSAQKTLRGRASKLLGRAGVAQLRNSGSRPLVFEGHRATADGRGVGAMLRMGAKTKSRGGKSSTKPQTRSARRAAAFQTAGGKKSKVGMNAHSTRVRSRRNEQ